MSFKLVGIVAAASAALGACGTMNKDIGQEDPAFGESVRYNAAVQTINPAPVYAENGAQPGDNGDRGAQAVKRYRTDQANNRHKSEASTAATGLSTTQGPK